jgi:polyisoprenoid-binding protein YceI
MAVTTWNIDPAHSDVQFSAKHMMMTTVRGRFTAVEGSIALDEENPTNSTGSFTVGVASLNTGVEQRDGHLRSADFFDTDNHPTATFSATSVESKGGSDYRVGGDLTIRGTTRPVSFDVELLGFYAGMDGARRAGLHATGRINREDFGLTWNVALESGGWLVGKEIRLELDLAIELAKPTAEAEPSFASDAAIAA